MAPTGLVRTATVPSHEDIVLPDDDVNSELQKAYVLIIGGGLASHWCSLWIFEKGEVYSMELMGYRMLQSRYKMRHLYSFATGCRTPPPPGPDFRRGEEDQDDEEDEHWCGEFSKLRAVVEYVWPFQHIWPHQLRESVQHCLFGFLHRSGRKNFIMTGKFKLQLPKSAGVLTCLDLICIKDTSPHDLRKRASKLPLGDAFYELHVHNCQLFLLQLLCEKYEVEVAKLPLTAGSIAAGPSLLLLEVAFIAIFHALRHWHPNFAMLVGLLWVAAEAYLTWRYVYSHALSATSGVVIGGVGTMCLWVGVAVHSPSDYVFVDSIPVLSLLWDLCMVAEALTVNMVYHDAALTLLNLMLVILAIVGIGILQFLNGRPVQELYEGVAGAVLGSLPLVFGYRLFLKIDDRLSRFLCASCLMYLFLIGFVVWISQHPTGQEGYQVPALPEASEGAPGTSPRPQMQRTLFVHPWRP
ncbi:unnamed protein product [Symbiodinium necroappetens]|uniref:Uncharacterized protein n=1 Tax=Symbiodinium necroappetens TaxID=1628268 RepID=A0A812TZ11_9DINO|nr:unnamed protein product [Symbiodinium necroappetens]